MQVSHQPLVEVVQCLEDICSRTHWGFPPPKLTSLVPKLLPLKIEENGWLYQLIMCLIYILMCPITPHEIPHQVLN